MIKAIQKGFLFGLFLLGSIGIGQAQVDSVFSTDQGLFLSEFKTYVLSQNREWESAVTNFIDAFEANMDDFSRESVMQAANQMKVQKLPAIPLYGYYVNAVNAFFEGQKSDNESFRNWNEVAKRMLERVERRKLNDVLDFLRFSEAFFLTGKLRGSDLGNNWKPGSQDWSFQYEEGQPQVFFQQTNLTVSRKQDSIMILATSGAFLPLSQEWIGKGGKVSWERFEGLEDVYAELADYKIDMTKGLYQAKGARLSYPLYFDGRLIEGTLEDKLVVSNKATEGSYPRFESYKKVLEIDNFGEGVKFKGGFRIRGTTIYGTGSKDEKATLLILSKDGSEVLFKGQAESFAVKREELIFGNEVAAALYLKGQDSLYHPSVKIRFEIPDRVLQLTRGKSGSDRYPFSSSYHGININAENIVSYLEADSLVIGQDRITLSTQSQAIFESNKFFDPSEYYRIQNITSVNPIAILRRVSDEEGTRYLDADYVAKQINPRHTIENIKGLLYELVSKGFIAYDSDRQMVEVKDKVFLYADADQGKVDYDQINIKSVSDSSNATMNMRNEALSIKGVQNLEFSRRQRVAVVPDEKRLTIKENRDLEFHGLVYAGFSTLQGRWFHFDYEPFQIRMDSIRYFDIYIPERQVDANNNSTDVMSLSSRIENLSGILLIDAPANKSGKNNIEMFPSFQSKGNAYVYYDSDSTYSRDSFYFELEPFSFNNLDQFAADDINFDGKMVSAGIFPDFEQTVSFQEGDRSLGFEHESPVDGFPIYGGRGTYSGLIGLNGMGLAGKGNLSYQNVSVDAEDFVFRPNQMTVSAESFDLDEVRTAEKEIPEVHGASVGINWKPYRDSMYVSSKEGKAFDLYKDYDVNFDGTVVLSSGGLSGIGTLEWDRAALTSELFTLGAASAYADTTSIGVKAPRSEDGINALYTEGVKGTVNFDEKEAKFESYDGQLETNLPYNEYKTSMNEFTWDMEKELIVFESDPGKPGLFTSVHPDQDSLAFEAQTAAYDLTSNDLILGGVPFIQSCDARIFPDSNRVFIQPGGVIPTLVNARIVADTSNEYHVINRAAVEILGKKSYKASGFYEYNIGNREQEILFESIIGERVGKGARSEKATETRATGKVSADDSLYIDFKTLYQGTISLNARSKNLFFDGFARFDTDQFPELEWFSVSSEGDKKDLAIQFDRPKNIEGVPLETGLFISRETAKLYPRLMMPLGFRKDRPILPVKGLIKYDLKSDAFILGDSSKVTGQNVTGQQFIVYNKNRKVEGEGKLEIGSGLQYINMDAAGEIKTAFPAASDTAAGPYADYEVEARIMAGINFIVPERLLRIMTNEIQAGSFDARAISYLTDINFYKKAAYELFPGDDPNVKESIEAISSGFLDLPPKVNNYTFLFSEIPMTWNSDYQSFISTEKELGLASINGVPIHKKLECYLEVKMPTNLKDRLYLYVKSPSGLFYFFGFKDGIMNVTSNNTAFMDELLAMKKKETIMKMADGQTYELLIVEPRTARVFLNRINGALDPSNR